MPTAFRLMVTISIYEALSRSLMAYAACVKKQGLRVLFFAFERVCYADMIVPYEGALRKWVHVSTWLAFLITGCGVSVDVYGVYGSSHDLQQLFGIYQRHGQLRIVLGRVARTKCKVNCCAGPILRNFSGCTISKVHV